MTNYIYADDAAPAFPKGTVIQVSAWYDNTKNNPNNPDPDQWVGYGDRTVDEMAHAWMNVVYLTDDEYKEWLDAKKARGHRRRRSSSSHACDSSRPSRSSRARGSCLASPVCPRPTDQRAASRLRRERHRRRTKAGSPTPTARTAS